MGATVKQKAHLHLTCSGSLRERAHHAIGRFELLVDSPGSELEKPDVHSVGQREAERLAKDLYFSFKKAGVL
jgi:hypothetical protein